MKELFLSKVIDAKDADNRPRFPKFTRNIHVCAGYLMWSEETNFSIDDHIRPYCGQPPKDEEQMKLLITDLCSKPLPSLKSSWEIVVIPLEYSQSNVTQTCILFRVSHFIADGISLMRLMIEHLCGNHGVNRDILKRMQNKFKPHYKNVFLNMLVNVSEVIYKYVFKNSLIPVPPKQSGQVFMKEGCELSGSAYFDWTSAIKLDTIKRIKDVTSTTVNDVLVSCMAGAFRKYFVKRGICPPDFLTNSIAISLHGPDEPVKTVNKVSAIATLMPTGDMDCLQRLKATKVEMDRLKRSPDLIRNCWFQKYCFNTIPYKMLRQTFEIFKFDAASSNIPGPDGKVAFNGKTVESMIPTQLPPPKIGFGVVTLTYAGSVTVAVSVDKARVSSRADLRQLLDDFVEVVQ